MRKVVFFFLLSSIIFSLIGSGIVLCDDVKDNNTGNTDNQNVSDEKKTEVIENFETLDPKSFEKYIANFKGEDIDALDLAIDEILYAIKTKKISYDKDILKNLLVLSYKVSAPEEILKLVLSNANISYITEENVWDVLDVIDTLGNDELTSKEINRFTKKIGSYLINDLGCDVESFIKLFSFVRQKDGNERVNLEEKTIRLLISKFVSKVISNYISRYLAKSTNEADVEKNETNLGVLLDLPEFLSENEILGKKKVRRVIEETGAKKIYEILYYGIKKQDKEDLIYYITRDCSFSSVDIIEEIIHTIGESGIWKRRNGQYYVPNDILDALFMMSGKLTHTDLSNMIIASSSYFYNDKTRVTFEKLAERVLQEERKSRYQKARECGLFFGNKDLMNLERDIDEFNMDKENFRYQ